MHWIYVSSEPVPAGEQPWLLPFVAGNRHSFAVVDGKALYPNWHTQRRAQTSWRRWLGYLRLAAAGVRATRATTGERQGLITLFPQLAACLGLHKQLQRSRAPCLAWAYNHGRLAGGAKRLLARRAATGIDRFVVHSRWEVGRYSDWLGLPAERFVFVPYQCPVRPFVARAEATERPYVVGLGSACRDYGPLVAAVRGTDIRVVLLASPRVLQGLELPANVEVVHGVGLDAARQLIRGARAALVLLSSPDVASGHVSVVEAMSVAVPVVATACPALADYVLDGDNGVAVPPGEPDALRQRLLALWADQALRDRVGKRGHAFAWANCSDEVAGARLTAILDELEAAPLVTAARASG